MSTEIPPTQPTTPTDPTAPVTPPTAKVEPDHWYTDSSPEVPADGLLTGNPAAKPAPPTPPTPGN
jgi:hypothetical protein